MILSGNTLYGTAVNGGVSGNGTVFALSLAPSAPIITTQPQSQTAQVGNNVTFTIAASDYPPPNYQWQFNGQNISGAMSSTLTLNSVTAANSGGYSVVVSNPYGSVTSAVARLIVYLPPATLPPSTPASSLTTLQPAANLIAAPRQPTSTQLVVFTGGGLMDPNKKTIVLTHGWRDTAAGSWPGSMAATLIRQGFGASANIVAWDWTTDANMPGPDPVSLSASSARTLSEGEALGSALLNTLGTGYNLPIHFIGHSLGTMVNCHAADYIHGDDPNSPGYSNPAQKFNSQNTQMTLFDEAELANVVSLPYDVSLDILFGAQIAAQSGVNEAPWNKVIPEHSAWIDNYISLVGLAHVEAANVLLWRNDQLGLTAAHGYSIQWYSNSIVNPSGSLMGHRWSSELTLSGAPARGSFFAQALNSDPLTLQLAPLDPIVATLDVYPSLQAFRALSALGSSVYGIYLDGIQYAGNFVANVAQEFTPPSGQPVYVGTANSTPAYYLPTLSSSPYQSGYTLQFTLQPSISSQLKTPGLSGPMPADSGGTATNSIYAWVPVSVPPDAVGLSFQFQLTGAGTNEYMTMGISNENYFALESKFVQDGAWTASSVMDVSQYAGQQVQLFFSLNGYGAAPSGQLSVQAIQFYTMSAPALSIAVQGTNAVLSWPVTALGWQLEMADTLEALSKPRFVGEYF
ncbi:MAG TPA: immunoglobulin domain-containing protein [Candidatus Paceibacterota bacterium]|nr:immunoglobulin domain-containing protein [Candidatus Paceibacterota bacterium]